MNWQDQGKTLLKQLRDLWRGALKLSDAFWTWGVIGGFLVNISTSTISLMLITFDRPWLALIIGYGASVPYNILSTIGIWRSAAGYEGPKLHADLARWTTAIFMSVLTLT